jgi:hypothetical protein
MQRKHVNPCIDRLQRLADELVVTESEGLEKTANGNTRKTPKLLKQRVLEFFDKFYAAEAPERRVLSSRVFSQASKEEYESTLADPGVSSSYSDMRYLKDFLSTFPIAPYWRV